MLEKIQKHTSRNCNRESINLEAIYSRIVLSMILGTTTMTISSMGTMVLEELTTLQAPLHCHSALARSSLTFSSTIIHLVKQLQRIAPWNCR
jgi:hypothetical protein